MELQTELDLLLTGEAEQFFTLIKRGFIYEQGDESGCLVALQARVKPASDKISQIPKTTGSIFWPYRNQ